MTVTAEKDSKHIERECGGMTSSILASSDPSGIEKGRRHYKTRSFTQQCS